MAIDGGMRARLEAGMQLVAKHKGDTHTAEVVMLDGKPCFKLSDGATYQSPSSAAKAITGTSVNGWRFWSVAD